MVCDIARAVGERNSAPMRQAACAEARANNAGARQAETKALAILLVKAAVKPPTCPAQFNLVALWPGSGLALSTVVALTHPGVPISETG